MEYFREELFPCVSLTAVQTDKFKTGCMTAYLLTQLHRETAAENAVLPYVLRRGTKSLPDMRRISERLDALYGAEIEPSVRKLGEIQAVGFYAGFAEDAFLPGETDVLGEVISLLSELWLSPATRGGLFLPAYVDSEREQLVERIERVKNDKRSWAFRRLRENMCAYATGAYGTADEAGSIHYVKLTKHYKELLAVSPMEIFYCGSRPGKEVAAMLREAFALLPRGEIDLDLGIDIRMNAVEEKPRYFTEEDEISQGARRRLPARRVHGRSRPGEAHRVQRRVRRGRHLKALSECPRKALALLLRLFEHRYAQGHHGGALRHRGR